MEAAYTLIAMLLVVAAVGLLARVVSTPYPVLLVGGGLGLGLMPFLHVPPLDPNLILLFFLPPLLYKEAFHTSWHDFSRWLRPIAMLSVGLVAVVIVVVAWVFKLMFPELPWAVAFIMGAVVSPTDTVAAAAVIRRLRVPRRLSAILGGESLVNDATGLVALNLAVGVVLSGAFSWVEVGLDFAWTVVGGVGIGLLAGAGATLVNRWVKDTTTLFAFSLLTPYVAFSAAHSLHASGVLAAVTAGFFVAWRIHVVAADTRYQLFTVWRLLAFLVDGVCFVLVGMEIPRLVGAIREGVVPGLLAAGCLTTLAVIVVRIVWMFPAAYLPLLLFPRLRRREGGLPELRSVLLGAWCGMRGAVSLAAALSLPLVAGGQPFPGRDQVIFCTFCVIIGTLMVQGLTLQPLIRWLGITDDARSQEEERLARVSLVQAAISRLGELKAEGRIPRPVIEHSEAGYLARLDVLINADIRRLAADEAAPPSVFAVELEAVAAERRRLLSLRNDAQINDMTQSRLQEELDVAEMRLRSDAGMRDATRQD